MYLQMVFCPFFFYTCFFLPASSPSFSTSKSHLAEAICIRLCNNIITKPRKETGVSGKSIYTSRCKLILSACNNVRSRLMNSQARSTRGHKRGAL